MGRTIVRLALLSILAGALGSLPARAQIFKVSSYTPAAAPAYLPFTVVITGEGFAGSEFQVDAPAAVQIQISGAGRRIDLNVPALPPGELPITLTARNILGEQQIADLKIQIQACSVTMGPATLPEAVVGVPYSATFTASGCTGQFTWELTGSLPAGLSGSALPVISGTPVKAGSSAFTITATAKNASGERVSRDYSITVSDSKPPCSMTFAPASLPTGVVGLAYSEVISVSGCTPPYKPLNITNRPVWLQVTDTAEQGKFKLSGTPIRAGREIFTLTAEDSAGNTKSYTYTLDLIGQPEPGPVPLVAPDSVTFEVPPNTPFDKTAVVSVGGAGSGTFSVSISGAPNWLNVQPSNGAMPGVVEVNVKSSGLAPGSYNTKFEVSAGATTVPVAVTINAKGSCEPLGEVKPHAISLGALEGSTALAGSFALLSTLCDPANKVIAEVLNPDGRKWLSVGVEHFTPTEAWLDIVADPAGLQAGTYRGTIRVKVAGKAEDIDVAFQIYPRGFILDTDFSSVHFTAGVGSHTTQNKVIQVVNRGTGEQPWTATVVSGSQWLTISPMGGVLSMFANLTLTANPAGLAPGLYYASVKIDAGGQTVYVTATMLVVGGGAPGVPPPGYFEFTSPSGKLDNAGDFTFPLSPSSPAQTNTVVLRGTSDEPEDLQVAAVMLPGRRSLPSQRASAKSYAAAASANQSDDPRQALRWLTVRALKNQISSDSPVDIEFTVDPKGLQPDVYRGWIVAQVGSFPATYQLITLIVAGEGCSSKGAVVNPSGIMGNFNIPIDSPPSISVRAFDDCGKPINEPRAVGGKVEGEPIAPWSFGGSGAFQAGFPWVPQGSATIELWAGTKSLERDTVRLVGVIGPTADPFLPLVRAVTNAANLRQRPIAPGSLITVFGERLLPPDAAAESFTAGDPASEELAGVRVWVGGLPAIPLYVSSSQINVVVFDLNSELPAQVAVKVGDRFGLLPYKAATQAFDPAVFSVDGASDSGSAAGDQCPAKDSTAPSSPAFVLNADGTVAQRAGVLPNVRSAPAHPGDTVSVVMTGLPVSEDRGTVVTRVFIGGLPAAVVGDPVAHGRGTGVYRLPVIVPAGLDGDEVPVQVQVGSVCTEPGLTIAVHP